MAENVDGEKGHIVFVETRYANFGTLRYALDAGYSVSYVGSHRYSSSYDGEEFRELQTRFSHLIWVDNTARREDVRSALAALAGDKQIDAVICFFEIAIDACATAADDLGIPFTNAIAVSICRDKLQCRAFLRDCGLVNIQWHELSDKSEIRQAIEKIGLPVIVKPRRGAVSKFIEIIQNEEDVIAFLAQDFSPAEGDAGIDEEVLSNGFLAEQYLSGKLYSVEILSNGRDTRCITVCEKIAWQESSFVELGAIIPASLNPEKRREIVDYSIACVSAVNLGRGIFHVEVIDTGEGIVLIEINPRIIGGNGRKMIISSYDFNLDKAIIDSYLGNDIDPFPENAVRTTVGHHIAPAVAGLAAKRTQAFPQLEEYVDLHIKLQEGSPVQPYRSNYDSQGWFITSHSQRSIALTRNRQGLDKIGAHFEIDLIVGTPVE
ncbi:ATP-grasp domain-containing protein [Agrobacterium rhizogenes]|nr:ATP-grasp domain-containing protein [Rhizobium rhizogenes]NTH53726.1 ATP-grasp domain-containing protein [Rhizobium rhizogenes]NTH73310.1 ATP-grasp domain-containing protein [Rhizobium rhizogenes]